MARNSVNKRQLGKATEAVPSHGNSLKACVVIGTIAILCYANSLFGEFVYDDYEVIETNRDIRPTTPISNLFTNDFWGVPLHSNKSHKSYRPITVLSFRWNFVVGGLNPIGYHAVNIVLHGLTSVLFLLVCARIFSGFENQRTNSLSFLCGLFFAVHPIHTEAVSDSVGRADILCGLFYLSALFSYMKSFPDGITAEKSKRLAKYSRLWLACCIFWCGLSLFSKEQGITVLGVCIVYDIVYACKLTGGEVWRLLLCPSMLLRPWPKWALRFVECLSIVAFTAIILLYVRVVIISGGLGHSFSESDNPTLFHPDFCTRLRTYCYLCALNAWLLLCPNTLCYDWSMDSISRIESWMDMRNTITLGFGMAVTWMTFYGLTSPRTSSESVALDSNQNTINLQKDAKSKETHPSGESTEAVYSHQRRRVVLLALSMMIVPFLPASNLFFPVGFVVAERILYIPSMGWCILVTLGVSVLFGETCSTSEDSNQNTAPRSSITWSFGLNKIGKLLVWSVLLIFVLKTVHRNTEWKNSESLARSGLKTNPTNAKIYMTLGNVLAKEGKLSCEEYYREALRLRPHYVIAWENLGLVLLNTERAQEAEKCYLKALSIRPNSPEGNINLAHLLRVTERFKEADVQYQKALTLRPDNARLNHFHGVVLEKLGKGKEAEGRYTRATKLAPDDPLSFIALGKILAIPLLTERMKHGKERVTKKAVDNLRKGVMLKPSDSESRLLLAHLYLMNEKTDSAEMEARSVLTQDPYNKEAEYILGRVSEHKGLFKEARQYYFRVLKKDFLHSGAKEAVQRLSHIP